MRTIITLLCILPVACIHGKRLEPQPYVGWLPQNTHLDLDGVFTFSPAGELSLALAEPCTIERTSVHGVSGISSTSSVPCDRAYLDMIRVVATTPWHSQIPGVWADAGHLVFRIDWKDTGLDPFDDNAATLVAQPWAISGSLWVPSTIEARRIFRLVSEAADSDGDGVPGRAVPGLEVTKFEVDDGTLRAGGESTLTLRIGNRSPGTAHRVVVTIWSGITSLHGQQLRFGMIKPGTEKTRQLRLIVPASETSPDTMLVIVLGEGSGFSLPNVSRRIPIAAATIAPELTVHCAIPDDSGSRPGFNAGDEIILHCVVDNMGTGSKEVELETSVAGAAPVRSPEQRVGPGAHVSFDIPVSIPRELSIDSAVEIAIAVIDRRSAGSARSTVVGLVRKPKLCVPGQLTRPQYRAKLTKLRVTLAAGNLTQGEFDRYDAALVTCLN